MYPSTPHRTMPFISGGGNNNTINFQEETYSLSLVVQHLYSYLLLYSSRV